MLVIRSRGGLAKSVEWLGKKDPGVDIDKEVARHNLVNTGATLSGYCLSVWDKRARALCGPISDIIGYVSDEKTRNLLMCAVDAIYYTTGGDKSFETQVKELKEELEKYKNQKEDYTSALYRYAYSKGNQACK